MTILSNVVYWLCLDFIVTKYHTFGYKIVHHQKKPIGYAVILWLNQNFSLFIKDASRFGPQLSQSSSWIGTTNQEYWVSWTRWRSWLHQTDQLFWRLASNHDSSFYVGMYVKYVCAQVWSHHRTRETLVSLNFWDLHICLWKFSKFWVCSPWIFEKLNLFYFWSFKNYIFNYENFENFFSLSLKLFKL